MNELRILTGYGSIDLLNPTADDVNMRDVCTNLSRIRRWNGAIDFTVGQHSRLVEAILKAKGANQATCLAGLLHDGHEYATGDIAGPMLKQMTIYEPNPGPLHYNEFHPEHEMIQVQQCIQTAIEIKVGLLGKDFDMVAVNAADLEARACEVWYLLPQSQPRRNLLDTQFQTEPCEASAQALDAILNGDGSMVERLAVYGVEVQI